MGLKKKILIGILVIFILFILSIVFFFISNKEVQLKEPTVTFKVVNNATSYVFNYRISNSNLNGWSPFKWAFLDRWYNRYLGSNWMGSKFNEKTITISKDGSIYFYNPGWKYKFGGGLQINGKDIKPNSKIYINAKMDIISLSGGKVYIEKIE
jgi:hypothetical protein